MLVYSLVIMGVATFLIGLLPTYDAIGVWAPVLLVVLRCAQGIGVGGEWGGAVLMSVEHAPKGRRGFFGSWPQIGFAAGLLISSGMLALLTNVLSEDAFAAWGWRVPFILSAVLVLVGLWVRLSIEESPVFSEAKAEIAEKQATASHMPLLEVIKNYPREVFIAMGMRMAENISYYIFTVISITYVTTYLGADKDVILQMLLIGAAFQFFLIPALGALSDRVGRRPLYLVGAVGVAVWAFVFFGLIDSLSSGKILLAVVVGLFFHSLMYAPQAAFFSELFGTSVRYTGASVGYQLASIFAGALAPIIAVELLGTVEEKNTTAVGIYMAIASVLTVIAVLAAKETRATSMRHDRVVRGAHK
jgi:MFS family permease